MLSTSFSVKENDTKISFKKPVEELKKLKDTENMLKAREIIIEYLCKTFDIDDSYYIKDIDNYKKVSKIKMLNYNGKEMSVGSLLVKCTPYLTNSSYGERIYHVTHDLKEIQYCPACQNVKLFYRNSSAGYSKFCRRCAYLNLKPYKKRKKIKKEISVQKELSFDDSFNDTNNVIENIKNDLNKHPKKKLIDIKYSDAITSEKKDINNVSLNINGTSVIINNDTNRKYSITVDETKIIINI